MKLLIFGDIVGKIGRRAIAEVLPALKSEYAPDLTIANVENLAHGRGISAKTINELMDMGVDAFTSGHHVWENEPGAKVLDDVSIKIVRPANVDSKLPGRGYTAFEIEGKTMVLMNLQGQLFMSQEASSPFLAFDRIWGEISKKYVKPVVILDMHAEATSEKQALGQYVDGRAIIAYGTHTHVPTADSKILSKGTAYITDVGHTGLHDGVIGFEKNSSIKRFLKLTEAPYELPDKGLAEVNALYVEVDIDSHRAVVVKGIREIVDI